MKFGIFDYIDDRGEPLHKTYDDRLALLQAAEAAGFYGYHLTEHQGQMPILPRETWVPTPFGLSLGSHREPRPGVFRAGAADGGGATGKTAVRQALGFERSGRLVARAVGVLAARAGAVAGTAARCLKRAPTGRADDRARAPACAGRG